MTATVLVGCVLVVVLIGLVAAVLELRRLGDLAEAINHAIERVAVELKRTR
jgi:MFS superfamily sulfate permease-like transporter